MRLDISGASRRVGWRGLLVILNRLFIPLKGEALDQNLSVIINC